MSDFRLERRLLRRAFLLDAARRLLRRGGGASRDAAARLDASFADAKRASAIVARVSASRDVVSSDSTRARSASRSSADERADASASARSDSRRRRSIRNANSAASRSRRRDAIASSRRDSASVVARAAAFASDSARRAISRTRASSRDWDSAASSADACSRTNSVSKATRGAHAARGSRDPENTVTDDRVDDAAESSASSPSASRTSSPSASRTSSPSRRSFPSPPPQTGAKATVTAAETTAGPSALATQARTVPFRASVASPASAACTNPTPASRHIAAARATAVSDASPRFTKTPPTPPVGFEPTTVVVRARTFVAVAASTATPRWAAPSGRSARTKGANAATTAAPEESDRIGAGAGGARPAGRRGGSGSLELLHGARGGECFVRAAMVAETNGGFALGDERGGGGGGVGGAFDPDRGARGGRGRGGERFGDGGVQGVRAREGGVDRAVALADGEPRDVHVVGRANAGRDGLRQRARAVRDEERDARETVARAGGRRARRGGRESRARSRDERRLRGVEARKRNRQGGYAGEEKEASTTTREE